MIDISNSYDKDYKTLTGIVATKGTNKLFDCSYEFEKQRGNLLSRSDNIRTKKEEFIYDDLSRLTDIKQNGTIVKTMAYALNGNLTSHSFTRLRRDLLSDYR